MATLKSCGFLILRQDPDLSFLLMRHHDRWDLPKGNMDEGESDLECAYRELVEETGIDSTDIQIAEEYRFVHEYTVFAKRFNKKAKEKQLVIYLAELIRPVQIQVTEHIGFEWFKWEPPHVIQERTINPLLADVEKFLQQQKNFLQTASPARVNS